MTDEGTGLTAFRVQESGKMLAAGASDGSTTLLDFCEGLAVMQPNEKQSIAQVRVDLIWRLLLLPWNQDFSIHNDTRELGGHAAETTNSSSLK